MKTNQNISIIALLVLFCFPSFSQTLSEKIASAKNIYVAPLQNYTYYGLKTGPGGTKPYSLTGEFNIGDMVTLTDPNYGYEIVGKVPDETVKSANDHLLSQLQEKWGIDKVKPWPEAMKNKMGSWNEKDIDCDLYVMMERAAWQEPLRMMRVDPGNPGVQPIVKGGMENIKIIVFEKVKAGKKGKKVVAVMKNPFTDLSVTVSDDYHSATDEFCKKANEHLQTVVDAMLTELFTEVEGK